MRIQLLATLSLIVVVVAFGCSGRRDRDNPVPPPAPSNPAVTGITPVSGDVAGGTSVTIQGSGFVTGAAVNIAGNAATGVTVGSATSITATTPAGSAGPADVTVINPDSQAATLTNGFTYTSSGGNQPPTFGGVSPASGPTAGGTVITVTGSGFYAGVTVTVGGGNATGVSLISGATLTCTTPSGGAGAADVVVTNLDAQSATGTGAFTYVPPPQISGFTPSQGPAAGGNAVTISGQDFVSGATVDFGGTSATITLFSTTSIEVNAPAGTGSVSVTVTNPDGQNVTAASSYTYVVSGSAPGVTSVTPNSGTVNGGTPVVVAGGGFLLGATVTFGGTAATNVVVTSPTQITCTTPAASATGAVAVTVNNPGGNSGALTNAYTYTAAGASLTVTSFTPTNPTGPAAGGTGGAFSITGTGFVSGANVTIYGLPATATVSSSTQINVTAVPAAGACTPAGPHPVVVANPSGETASATGFTWTPNQPEGLSASCSNPDIAVDGTGVIHVVFEGPGTGSGDVLYVRSTDNGRTWSSPANLSNTSAASQIPHVAAQGNTLLIVWLQLGSTASSFDYVVSTDNGQNWSSVASLPLPSSGNGPAMGLDVDLDANGRAVVAYLWNTGIASQGGSYVYVYAVTAAPGSLSSASATQISGLTTTNVAAWGPATAADGSGVMGVAWGEITITPGPSLAGGGRVEWSRTTNGGTSWSAQAALYTPGSGSGLSTNPVLALRGTDAVIAFNEMYLAPQVGTSWQLVTLRSTSSGSTWSSTPAVVAQLVNGNSQPALAVDAGAFFGLAWDDTNGSTADLRCARSSDAAQTWTTPMWLAPSGVASSLVRLAGGAAGVLSHVWCEYNGAIPGHDLAHW